MHPPTKPSRPSATRRDDGAEDVADAGHFDDLGRRCLEHFHTSGSHLDRDRQGVSPAEGAGIILLGWLEHAGQHGVPILAEMVGYGSAKESDSTKPVKRHSQAATGAHGAIFCLLMLQDDFVEPTPSFERPVPEREGVRRVRLPLAQPLTSVMTFNWGPSGANACLKFGRV